MHNYELLLNNDQYGMSLGVRDLLVEHVIEYTIKRYSIII